MSELHTDGVLEIKLWRIVNMMHVTPETRGFLPLLDGFHLLEKIINQEIKGARQAAIEQAIELVGEDENEFDSGFGEGKFMIVDKKTREEVPLRLLQKEMDRNELRQELRQSLLKLLEK